MATIARETASRLRVQHPEARYELDWKTPEQLLVAAALAGGSRDAAVNDVTKVLFARRPDTRALARADVAQLMQVIEPLGFAQQKAPRKRRHDDRGDSHPQPMDHRRTRAGPQPPPAERAVPRPSTDELDDPMDFYRQQSAAINDQRYAAVLIWVISESARTSALDR